MTGEFRTVKVPVLDTGIGQAGGYKNDAELVEAARKQREALPPEIREMIERVDSELERHILSGDS